MCCCHDNACVRVLMSYRPTKFYMLIANCSSLPWNRNLRKIFAHPSYYFTFYETITLTTGMFLQNLLPCIISGYCRKPPRKFCHRHVVTADCREVESMTAVSFSRILCLPSFVNIGRPIQELKWVDTFVHAVWLC
jgi:hypothetical protein